MVWLLGLCLVDCLVNWWEGRARIGGSESGWILDFLRVKIEKMASSRSVFVFCQMQSMAPKTLFKHRTNYACCLII